METKQQKIVLDYVHSTNLEAVVQEAMRTIIKSNVLPDNPYGSLARHFQFTSYKEDMKKLIKRIRKYQLNTLAPSMSFNLTHLKRAINIWGLPHLLQYMDSSRFTKLQYAMNEIAVDGRTTYGHYVLNIRHSYSGGYVLKSNILPYPEISTSPLQITAQCLVEGPAFEPAFTLFADWVYDDIVRIGSSNTLHMVKEYYVSREKNTSHVAKIPFEMVRDNKQLFVAELKGATIQRKYSYFKVKFFTRDVERLTEADLLKQSSGSRYLSQAFENAIIDRYEYIPGRKVYVMHWIDSLYKGNGQDKVEWKSMEHLHCNSLFSGVFSTENSAQLYANIFYTHDQQPLNKQFAQDYRDGKRKRALYLFNKGRTIESLWELFEYIITQKDDNAKSAIIEEMIQVFSHRSCKIYKIVKFVDTLKILINAYYDTGHRHLQKLSETVFASFREETLWIFGSGASSDLIILRPLIDRMISYISLNNTRVLNFHSNTLRVLDRIQEVCICVARNATEMILRHTRYLPKLISALTDNQSDQIIITHAAFLAQKKPTDTIDVLQIVKTNKLEQKQGEVRVLVDYLKYTNVINLLIKTTRSILFCYPLLPNPLHIFGTRMAFGLVAFDMENLSNDQIIDKYISQAQAINNFTYRSSANNRIFDDRPIPYLVGPEACVVVADQEWVGIFGLIFNQFDINNLNQRGAFPPGYEVKPITSICGRSLFNGLLNKQPRTQWHVATDVFIVGHSFNAGMHAFLEYVIQYALWLDTDTSAIVSGFFTYHVIFIQSEEPLANFQKLTNQTDRRDAYGLLLSAFQVGSVVWLRIYIQEKTNNIMHIFAVNVYFNYHFKEVGAEKFVSIIHPANLEDYSRVYFNEEDYFLWTEVAPPSASNYKAVEKLYDSISLSFDMGQYYRAYVSLIFVKLYLKSDEALNMLRMRETVLEMVVELADMAETIIDVMILKAIRHRKLDQAFANQFIDKFSQYLTKALYVERLVFLESLMPPMLRVLNRVKLLSKSTDPVNLQRAITHTKWLKSILNVISKVVILTLHDYFMENKLLAPSSN